MLLQAPVSLGECVDKMTILEIKSQQIKDPQKLANVNHELNVLETVLLEVLSVAQQFELQPLKNQLKQVNEKLWHIEDDIRNCERAKDFGQTFIQLARAVYVTNDQRADLKKSINLQFGSAIVEEKSYQSYQ